MRGRLALPRSFFRLFLKQNWSRLLVLLKRFAIILHREVSVMDALAIGVDLGGTNLRIAAVDQHGKQLENVDTAALIEKGPNQAIAEISARISSLAAVSGPTHRFKGVGLGIPGILDPDNGNILSAGNLPGWRGYPLRQELEQRLKVRVWLENDANCAALGEKWLGAGQQIDDLCMITLGTGVGGGFVVNGKPWHGITGMAGEIGHMTVVPDGAPCVCGSCGCLEQYASATAIRRMAREAIRGKQSPLLAAAAGEEGDLSARAVFECARLGDPTALRIFETAGKALGIALANLINVFNLPLYVIGGGVAKAWEVLRPALFAELNSRSIVFRAGEPLRSQRRGTTITPTVLGDHAGVLGAARLPLLTESCSDRCSAAS
jgi:glucokinase